MTQKSQLIPVLGAELQVVVDGDERSPALLLWPPGSCNLHVWDHLISDLANRFLVIRIDVRGYGESVVHDHRDELFTFEQYTADACKVLDHLGVSQCHSWSQSWGTRAAMVFAATQTERVISTALYAANVDLPNVEAQRKGSKEAAEIRRKNGIEEVQLRTEFTNHRDPSLVSKTSGALRKFELASCIPQLNLPVLIATGTFDPNLVSSRIIAKQAPNAELVELEHVGHNAILEHPKLALQTFIDFQDRL